MQQERVPIKQFVKQQYITLSAEWTERNPYMDDPEWERVAAPDHWKVTLRRRDPETGKRYQMTTYFSMGVGYGGREPVVEEVLDSLAMDASGVENARDFEDWASEYGYDTDSRKAERSYRACQKTAAQLKRFLDDDLYDTLLWHVDTSEY